MPAMWNLALGLAVTVRSIPLAKWMPGIVMMNCCRAAVWGVPPNVSVMVVEPGAALAVTVMPAGKPMNQLDASTLFKPPALTNALVSVMVAVPETGEPTMPLMMMLETVADGGPGGASVTVSVKVNIASGFTPLLAFSTTG